MIIEDLETMNELSDRELQSVVGGAEFYTTYKFKNPINIKNNTPLPRGGQVQVSTLTDEEYRQAQANLRAEFPPDGVIALMIGNW